MSALRSKHPAHRQIADALSWLHARAQPGAHLHADTRSLVAGDVFLAYAVDGADNRPFIDSATSAVRLRCCISPKTSRVRWIRRWRSRCLR
jgi:UDP-N-acetylmuramoyl-L-alanyl-D-glutamate--2,6-diaminopimelate ligase